jgi:hypothetical protein
LIRIAVSPRAYRAIKATLPAGSVVYPPERSRAVGFDRRCSRADNLRGISFRAAHRGRAAQ